MLYVKIRAEPKLASYAQRRVLLLVPPGGGSSALTGSASVSIISYDSRRRTAERGGNVGSSPGAGPTATASPPAAEGPTSPDKSSMATRKIVRPHESR